MPYIPSEHTVSNKSYGPAQGVPTDARSMFFDDNLFIYRPYQSTAEVDTYLNIPKYKEGAFPIYINEGGTLNINGTFSGGAVAEYWYPDPTGPIVRKGGSFLGLNDTPDSYSGKSNNLVTVNNNGNGLSFLSIDDFVTDLDIQGGSIVKAATRNAFPLVGEDKTIYIDLSTRIPYYWHVDTYFKFDSFSSDIVVSLTGGRNFLRWSSGQTIPANGKTAKEILMEGSTEPIAPTLTLNRVSGIPEFNQTSVTNIISYSAVANSLNATIITLTLEYSFNNAPFVQVTIPQPVGSNVTGTFNSGAITVPNFYTGTFRYRLSALDSAGASNTSAILVISPRAYVNPTVNLAVSAQALNGPQTNALRERGNIRSNISSTLQSNNPLVPINTAVVQFSTDGGTWTNIGSPVVINSNTGSIAQFLHDNSSLLGSNSLSYRVVSVDGFSTFTSAVFTINFRNVSYLGYSNQTVLSSALVNGLENGALLTSRARVVSGVTAGVGMFTYIAYPTTFGAISGIIMDGATPVLGAFSIINNTLSVTNQYGVATNYIIYRSNATNAFTNSNLNIT